MPSVIDPDFIAAMNADNSAPAPAVPAAPAPKKCKGNTFGKNIATVSLTELLTLDVIAVGAAACAIGCAAGLHGAFCLLLVLASVVILAFVEGMLCIPSNAAYYLGIGAPPHRFKVCKCYKDEKKPAAGTEKFGIFPRPPNEGFGIFPRPPNEAFTYVAPSSEKPVGAVLGESFTFVPPGAPAANRYLGPAH